MTTMNASKAQHGVMRALASGVAAALVLSACGGQHGTPAVAATPAASSPAALFDQVPACTNGLEAEFDQVAHAGKTATVVIPVPSACQGLSHAQVQALADEISGNYAQAQAFASAFAQAMAQ